LAPSRISGERYHRVTTCVRRRGGGGQQIWKLAGRGGRAGME
jgi:hypothetical protein